MSAPQTYIASSVFIRPRNLRFSTILQTLAVARHASQASGGQLISLSAVREAEMQRILNFMSVTFRQPRHMQAFRAREEAAVAHLSRRILRDRASVLYDGKATNRGVGLREVAPLIGLDLDATLPKAKPPSSTAETNGTRQKGDPAGSDLLLAGVDLDPADQKEYAVDLKMEPRARVGEKNFGHPQWTELSPTDQKQLDSHMFHFLSA